MSDSNRKRQRLACALSLVLAVGPQWSMQAMALGNQTQGQEQHKDHQHGTATQEYYCPMHPEVTSHKPGRCPKCNMFLVKDETTEALAEPTQALQKTYVCPMHPEVTSHEPGRCPKCNMFLVEEEEEEPGSHAGHAQTIETQVTKTKATENKADDHSQHAMQQTKPALEIKPAPLDQGKNIKYVCPMHSHIISDVPGTCPICGMNLEKVEMGSHSETVEIDVSGQMQQALALKVAKVERDTLWKFVKTVGQIDYDESQISHIHARVNGWIEKLKVESVGDRVEKGQLLYEIYSPDLVNAQDDYLLAQDTLKRSGNSANYQELLRKAGLRLELLGMNQEQIKQLAKTGKTQYRVPFYARESGIVKQLAVRDGMYIQPQTEVMSLVDLSKVWVIADVFENEQSWLEVGQTAEVNIPAMGLKGIEGKIDYIYPELDPITRSLRVRVVLNNDQAMELRPKTLAKVSLYGGPKRDTLVIPQEALIQTGKENRVIVKQDDASFSARKVTVGMLSQGKAEILDGLHEGENVVISGQFLLDSEASLKGSLMRLSSGHQH
ncbi:efflux RND transporter periplasmic adaptor subunit [Shewanella algae]|uniref:efflux RND transporter periplasmic adaptor subunit n=1 Tax=Shewanella algae TaxID=38313 RepID=UPI001AAFAEDB|nr:efflux RND transporter periplasmic adaptor subunit [Shewanella algae]MBO2626729.1 efflux RND transporter periplasmic adaptor subunit [Shewanella algae]